MLRLIENGAARSYRQPHVVFILDHRVHWREDMTRIQRASRMYGGTRLDVPAAGALVGTEGGGISAGKTCDKVSRAC